MKALHSAWHVLQTPPRDLSLLNVGLLLAFEQLRQYVRIPTSRLMVLLACPQINPTCICLASLANLVSMFNANEAL